jgi:DNA-directed RNA polymerase subunit M/transcription elongation factor TFIIS
VICPNCDEEMVQDEDDEELWVCESCGHEEDRS